MRTRWPAGASSAANASALAAYVAASPWHRTAVLAAAILVASGAGERGARAEEVPFVTTPDAVTEAMLEIAGTGAADHVIDLGSGDGRIVIAAARRHGASGLGVEIVPELVARSRAAARAAGVDARVEFRVQDLFATDLATATVVTMYLLPEVNLQLRSRLLALAPGTRIVSHDWDLGDWRPDRTRTLPVPDKALGLEKVSRVHLWIVPARIDGRWCAPGATLDVVQRFQRFSAVWTSTAAGGAPAWVFDGAIRGRDAVADGLQPAAWHLDEDDRLATRRSPAFGETPAFRRAGAAGCR